MTELDDAHVAVELEVLGANGEPLQHQGTSSEAVATYGVRSAQHRQRMWRGWFAQREGVPTAQREPFPLPVRFLPTDLEVPKGGRLRLTVSGSVQYSKGESLPSGRGGVVTILHNCERASVLRFLMPKPSAKLLNVRERDEAGRRLSSRPAQRMGRRTGGGLATANVCGQPPKRIDFLRPVGLQQR
jgi:hypothetical protein